jgi:hypothetical protein
VQQVVADLDAVERRADRVGVGRVGLSDLDVARPVAALDPAPVANHDAHPVPRGQQLRNQPAAHVAGRAGHQAQLRVGVGGRPR